MKKRPIVLKGALLAAGFLLLSSCASSSSSSVSSADSSYSGQDSQPSSTVSSSAISSPGEEVAITFDKTKSYVTAKLEELTLDYIKADASHPEEGYYVHDYKGSAKNLIIPDTVEIEGEVVPIVGIGDYAFTERKYPETLVVGENLHSITNNAFYSSPVQYLFGTRNLVHFDLSAQISSIKTSYHEGVSYIPSKDNPFCAAAKAKPYSLAELHLDAETLTDGVINTEFVYQSSLKVIGKRNKPVIVPENIQEISLLYAGPRSFQSTSLNRVSFTDGAFGTIGEYAFSRCYLKEAVIGEGVQSLGDCCFSMCTKLTSVSIAGSVSKIGNCCFIEDSSLSSITFENGIKEIGDGVFRSCRNLTSLDLPPSLGSIGSFAFAGLIGLKEVRVASSDLSFGYGAFSGCTSLSKLELHTTSFVEDFEDIFISCPLEYVSKGGLSYFGSEEEPYLILIKADSKDITEANIEPSCKSIGGNAFKDCTKLTSLSVPDGVIAIGNGAFHGARNLAEIRIPSSLRLLGLSPFYSIKDLNLKYEGSERLWLNIEGKEYLNVPNTKITSHLYLNGSSFEASSFAVPEGYTEVEAGSFDSCTNLKLIDIPSSVKNVAGLPDNADLEIAYHGDLSSWLDLSGKKNLKGKVHLYLDGQEETTTLRLPNDISFIEPYTFYRCAYLEEITIPEGLDTIMSFAFAYCNNLERVSIPNSLEEVGEDAFKNCEGLAFTEKDGSKYLGNADNPHVLLFKAASDLTEFAFLSSTRAIYQSCFIGNTSLKKVTFPSGLKVIPYHCFYGCSSLISASLPSGLRKIDSVAFCECSSLTSVSIPDSIESIPGEAFFGCSSLNYKVKGNGKYLGNASHPYLVLVEVADKTVTSFNVDSSTKIIYSTAFSCVNILDLSIPNGIRSIAAILIGLTNLDGFTPNKKGHLLYIGNAENPYLVCIGKESGGSWHNYVIEEGCKCISSQALRGLGGVPITIPSSVVDIGFGAFGDADITFNGTKQQLRKALKYATGNFFNRNQIKCSDGYIWLN